MKTSMLTMILRRRGLRCAGLGSGFSSGTVLSSVLPWRALAALSILAGSVLASGPALADDLRDLCPTRPGLATPPCIVDPGHVLVEVGALDWTLDRQAGTREDTLLSGDFLVRLGVDAMTEVQIGWTPFGTVRTRADGVVQRASGVGDMTLAVKRSLTHPDGSGLSIAVQPYATAPTGGSAIGAGDWGAGLLIPLSMELSDTVQIALTPELDGAVDGDRHGRHLAYGGVVGLGIALGPAISTAVEFSMMHDDDPEGASDQSLAALSFAWQPGGDWQVDLGSAFGLNHASQDAELYIGVARRF